MNETTTFLLVTLPNIHRSKKLLTVSAKTFLNLVIATVGLPRNLSSNACCLALKFHNVVWQHMQGVVEFLITNLLQF